MPVPKRKTSRARRDSRAAGKYYIIAQSSNCNQCFAFKMPHTVCMSCGFYNGKKVVRTKQERSKDRDMTAQAKTMKAQSAYKAAEASIEEKD